MADPKDAAKLPAPKGPDRKAVDMLLKVVHDSQPPKRKDEPRDPETLPEDWGIGDLVSVGKARLSHAIFGKPKPDASPQPASATPPKKY